MQTKPLVDDASLVNTLASCGVHILRPGQSSTPLKQLNPPTLIAALAGHAEPRLRESLIPLFLRQPPLHEYVPELAASLEMRTADVLCHLYTAAVYLQRFWLSTLQLYLGKFTLLPDYFGQSRYHLPSPDEHFGEAGLRALAGYYTRRTGYEWLAVYETAITLLLAQLSLEPLTSYGNS